MKLFNKINSDELKQRLLDSGERRITLSFYKYAHIPEPEQFRNRLYLLLDSVGVFGRIYVAKEGINAQISVPEERFEDFKKKLYSIDFLDGVRLNIAIEDDGKSFFKLKIKVREKIVADGLNDATFDASQRGKHLDAQAYNILTDAPDTLVVDIRNHYESEVGYFENAIRPDVTTFRESLPIVEEMLAGQKDRKVVMYCTGGIRCEKASAYFLHKGFQNVFMVDGGIIEYSRQCKEQGLPNKFIGKNFVFDERLGERISEAVVARCHQCGAPCDTHVNCANDACHLLFIQCPACAGKYAGCCSTRCADFAQLPENEQVELRKTMKFNGTKFSKGSYKAFREGMDLEMG